MTDELINILNLKSININKDLSFAKNDKGSHKIHIFVSDVINNNKRIITI